MGRRREPPEVRVELIRSVRAFSDEEGGGEGGRTEERAFSIDALDVDRQRAVCADNDDSHSPHGVVDLGAVEEGCSVEMVFFDVVEDGGVEEGRAGGSGGEGGGEGGAEGVERTSESVSGTVGDESVAF